mmetsp:Transcript_34747/g.77282  ORF Transcript_34747/g.77282 Transcript_34747/m.77282 type:complete len:266 (-) Transcript_34747:537-1334(-)
MAQYARPPVSISLPGAGVLLFWQLGVLHGLSRRYDTSKVPLVGSSSGAVAASLAASGACLQQATHTGLELIEGMGIMQRPLGFAGKLGEALQRWLHEALPDDAGERCSKGRATLLVTKLPLLRAHAVSDFRCKRDLIRVVLSSAHIPLMMDGSLYSRCRGSACIDGGLWWLLRGSHQEYLHPRARSSLLVQPRDDPGLGALHGRRHSILARPAGRHVAQEMWERGVEHAARLGERHAQVLQPLLLQPAVPDVRLAPSMPGAGGVV